jgi:hypothetical protein
MVVGGGMKDSGTDGTRETTWYVLFSERWWVVEGKTVGQMGRRKNIEIKKDTNF